MNELINCIGKYIYRHLAMMGNSSNLINCLKKIEIIIEIKVNNPSIAVMSCMFLNPLAYLLNSLFVVFSGRGSFRLPTHNRDAHMKVF